MSENPAGQVRKRVREKVKIEGVHKISRVTASRKPTRLDEQAIECFAEDPIEFPSPIETDPLTYGIPGEMFHVNTTSGYALELPGGGTVIEKGGEKYIQRNFSCRESRSGIKKMAHRIIAWHRMRDDHTAYNDSCVICYGAPKIERINPPKASRLVTESHSDSSTISQRPGTSPILTFLFSSSQIPPDRNDQCSQSEQEDHNQSSCISDQGALPSISLDDSISNAKQDE